MTAPPPAPTRRLLPALTGLRFIAALQVVVYHAGLGLLPRLPAPVRDIGESGYVGVSMFFVLSGFVLAYNYMGQPSRPLDRRGFWAARVARVYPVYLLSLIVALPLYLGWVLAKFVTDPLPTALAKVTLTTVANIALVHAWITPTVVPWNYPGWSLSVEAFFYALFPTLAAWVTRRRAERLGWVAVGVWLISLVPPAAYVLLNPDGAGAGSQWLGDTWVKVIKWNPLFRLPEFVLGVIVGWMFLTRRPDARAARLGLWAHPSAWATIAALAIVVVEGLSSHLPYVFYHNSLLAPLFAVLILALAHGHGALAWVLSRRPVVLLGEASYALYLLHLPILRMAELVPPLAAWRERAPVFFFLAYVAFSIALSILVLRAFEEPMRRRCRQALSALANRARARGLLRTVPDRAAPDGSRLTAKPAGAE